MASVPVPATEPEAAALPGTDDRIDEDEDPRLDETPETDASPPLGAAIKEIANAYRVPPTTPLRVAPGVEGFGTATTTGGRGGRVLVVTSREMTGPGTLAEALATPGPRIVLFDLAGELICPGPLAVAPGDVSVYGQSAPGDGVYFRADPHSVWPAANVFSGNVFFQHCRFRPGASTRVNGNRDAVAVGTSDGDAVADVVFDHCSFSWGTDELVDIWYGSHDITFHRCLIYEGLYHSTSNGTGTQSYPALIGGGSHRVSMNQCVMAHGDYRMPAIFSAREVDVFNCIVAGYTSVPTVLQCQYDDRDVTGNIEACLYIDSFETAIAEVITYANVKSAGRIRMNVRGNGRVTGASGGTIGAARLHTGIGIAPDGYAPFNGPRVDAPRPAAIPLDRLERTLLADVGAMHPVRDAADRRAIDKISRRISQIVSLVDGEVRTETNGALVGTAADVAWPTLASGPSRLGAAPDFVPPPWKERHGLAPDVDTSRSDSNGDGYLDIEDWLVSLAPAP